MGELEKVESRIELRNMEESQRAFDMKVKVEKGKIVEYRVNLKVTFILEK